MTPTQFFQILRARRWLALTIFLVTVLTSVGVGLLLPAKYTATASLILDQSRPDPLSSATYVNPSPAFMSTQVDVLKSDRVALHVVRKLNLTEQPKMHDKWMEATKGQGSFEVWLANSLQKMTEVAPARDSNVITVGVDAPDPKLAASLANALVQAYLDVSLELRVDPAKQYSSMFDSRAKELRADVERAQAKLTAFQREKGIVVSDERLDGEMARLNELSSQLTSLQAVASESSSRQQQVAGGGGDRMQEVMTNPMLQGLRSDLSHAEARLQELNSRLGENHPQVLEAKANIASLRSRLDVETRRVTGSVVVTNSINRQREAEIRGSLEAQRARVLHMKSVRDEGLVLLHDVETAQRAYDNIQSRLNQTSLESHATQSQASILSEATPPLLPSSPKVLVNSAIAVVVGILLAIGGVLWLELLDPRVRTVYEASTLIGVPLLGVLPRPGGNTGYTPRKTPLVMPKILGLLAAPQKEA